MVSGAHRVPAPQPPAVRRPDLLHLPVRDDGAGPRGEPGTSMLVPTAHDEPAIRLEIFKDVFSQAPRRSATSLTASDSSSSSSSPIVRCSRSWSASASTFRSISRIRACRTAADDDGAPAATRGRRRGGGCRDGPTERTCGRPTSTTCATSRRTCWRAARCSAGATGCTARSRSTADASIQARAARS